MPALLAESVPEFPLFIQVLMLTLGGVTAVLVIAHHVKQLFFSKVPDGQEAVTEKHLEQVQKAQEQQLQEFRLESRESRAKLAENAMELQKQQNVDRDYAHTAVHKLQTDFQVQFNRVALLEQKIQDNVISTLVRVEGRLDRLDRGMSNLGKKISLLMGRLEKHEEDDRAVPENRPAE